MEEPRVRDVAAEPWGFTFPHVASSLFHRRRQAEGVRAGTPLSTISPSTASSGRGGEIWLIGGVSVRVECGGWYTRQG